MEDDPFQSLGIGNALDVHFPANDPQFPAPTNQFGCENDLNQWPHLQMRHQQSGINTDDLDPNPMNLGIPEPPSNFRSKIGIPHKSQPCFLFQRGDCYYGSNCHFAHGVSDLKTRPPIEILEDNRRIINQMRLCKSFVNGGECPYGDQCQFLHQSLEKMKGDLSNDELHPRCSTKNLNQKPLFWKTRMCKKWEATGYCPYGIKCCFAHGLAELNTLKTQTTMDSGNLFTVTQTTAATVNDSSSGEAGTESGCKKFLFKWTDVQKIGRIYADWIDDNRITSFC